MTDRKMTDSEILLPRSLHQGSRVAIVSPAGRARPDNVASAVEILSSHGWEPVVSPHALGVSGSYSGTIAQRLDDISAALLDPEIDAIICSRGGYGAVQLLEGLNRLPLRHNPKWLVGFSDITALHGLMMNQRIASVHGPMTKHISANGGNNPDFRFLTSVLEGRMPGYTLEPHPLNRVGRASGLLAGGNLAVASGLTGTPFSTLRPGSILFIEDIAEPIYKVQRQLYQLRLSGVLGSLAGLLVGRFTDYRPDSNYSTMEEMIREMIDPYDFPAAFGIPAGHGGRALPLLMGWPTELNVTEESVRISALT